MTTRRGFVQGSVAAGALLGLTPRDTLGLIDAPEASELPPASGVDYYDKLGVPKIINAAGTYTYLTAALMPPEVVSAVMIAAQHPVRLRELQDAAGRYIAQRLQCEAALVSSGAQGAIILGTAGCMTLGKPDESEDLPLRVSAMKTECIIQKSHRFKHDQAIEMCGMKLVEVVTPADFEAAINPRTGMAFYYNAASGGQILHQQFLQIAHAHGVPCFIDAAADMPPIANLWNYTKMGFDLVAFSGGKGIRGPQNAGLLLGRKDLIAAAAANNNPNDRSVGRGMKVAKEQVVGMVAAVDWILSQTDEQIDAEARRRAQRIIQALDGLPTIKTEVAMAPVGNHVPTLLVSYDQARIAITPAEVAVALRKGKPSIEVDPNTGKVPGSETHHGVIEDTQIRVGGPNDIVIGTWMLKPGEDAVVGKRLHDVLQAAVRPA